MVRPIYVGLVHHDMRALSEQNQTSRAHDQSSCQRQRCRDETAQVARSEDFGRLFPVALMMTLQETTFAPAVRKWLAVIGIFGGATIAWAVPAHAQHSQPDPRVADLVTVGKLRVGVFPSFQYSKDSATGQPRGLAIGIARALATRLGLGEVITVEHPTPPQVVQCVKTGACDVGFMLIDPARTIEVGFTPPFVRSDFTYLLPAGSSIRRAADVDRPGVRIAAVRGHASTAALVRIITQAQPVYADEYDPTFELLRTGNADAFASIQRCSCNILASSPARGCWKIAISPTSRGSQFRKGM